MMTRTVAAVSVVCLMTAGQASLPTIERDIAYGADSVQRLDLHVPAGRGFSTVLFVHGGSLVGGDKGDGDYGHVCEPFAAAGVACANVNYRLLPAHAWPAPAEDVAAATRWIVTNIASRGGDPRRVFLIGHSSGAMLVALVGADAHYLSDAGVQAASVRGVISMGSVMWDEDLEQAVAKNGVDRVAAGFARDPRGQLFGALEAYRAQWPARHIRAGMPPYLFLVAESEQVNPPVLATDGKFAEDARLLGNQVDVRVLAGRTHYSAIRQLHQAGDEVFAIIQAWMSSR